MSGPMDTLCLRLLDLARAQHAALAEGNLDEALTLMEQRQGVCEEIRRIGGGVRGDAVRQVQAIDQEIFAGIRTAMEDIAGLLDGTEKLKRYRRDAAMHGADRRTHLTV